MAPDRGVKRRERKEQKVSVLQPKALMMKTKPKKGVETTQQASVRKQIRNLQRLLRRDLSQEVRDAQEKRLRDLQSQISSGSRLKHDRAMSEKYKKVRFFERRKVERRIRRTEKELRSAPDEDSKREAADRLRQLKQDLEYVRFFPKTEKYVSLFMSNDDKQAVARREKLRESIAANVAAAAAAGIDLEETGSEEDFTVDMTQDEFFLQAGSDEEDGSAEFKDELHSSVTTNSKPTKQVGANNNKNSTTSPGKRRSQNQTHKQEKRDRPSLGASSVLTRNKQQQGGAEQQWHYHPGPIGQSQQQQQHHENANHAEKEKRKRKRKRPPKKK